MKKKKKNLLKPWLVEFLVKWYEYVATEMLMNVYITVNNMS